MDAASSTSLLHGAGIGGGAGLGAVGIAMIFKEMIQKAWADWIEERRATHAARAAAPQTMQDALLKQIEAHHAESTATIRKDLEERRLTEKENLQVLQSHAVSLENLTASMRAQSQKMDTMHDQLSELKGAVGRSYNGGA